MLVDLDMTQFISKKDGNFKPFLKKITEAMQIVKEIKASSQKLMCKYNIVYDKTFAQVYSVKIGSAGRIDAVRLLS
jgi:hypothetical protein